jgi:hypothetical protein
MEHSPNFSYHQEHRPEQLPINDLITLPDQSQSITTIAKRMEMGLPVSMNTRKIETSFRNIDLTDIDAMKTRRDELLQKTTNQPS